MRKLKLQVQMSIDGFIGGPNGEMDWLSLEWTPDINQFVAGIVEPVDTIVLGRKLAEGFIPYWASVAEDPAHPELAGGKKFTETPKIVFTKTLAENHWPNTKLAKGDLTEEIMALKEQPGNDIYACGGASFVSSLIKHNLVDEYYLFVNPVAIGKGLPIFNNIGTNLQLKLVKATPFECGIVCLQYAR